MYGLEIVNGDLNLGFDGDAVKVSGADRIAQELTCWILEPFGYDKMYSGFGSTLYEKVGGIIDSNSKTAVNAEVTRVVKNYIEYQRKQYQQSVNSSSSDAINAWSKDDIIARIDSIDVSGVADSIKVVVKLTTASGANVEISEVI